MKKIILYYYIFSIFTLANDGFFNFVFSLVGLSFWRQAIWAIGIIILIKCVRSSEKFPYIRNILHTHRVIFTFIGIFSFITLLVDGFSVARIFYTIIEYSYGIPFIFLPFFFSKNDWNRCRINKLFIIFGTFLTTGLLLDYLSNGMFSMLFRILSSEDEVVIMGGKYTFLSTTDSMFTIYYSLCLFCCFCEYISAKSSLYKIFLLGLSVYFVFGSIFCGARQTLAALAIVEAFGLLVIMKARGGQNLLLIILGFILLLIAMPYAEGILSGNEGFHSRYTSDAIKEDDRTETWKTGFIHCFINTTPRRLLIGDGVGLTHGKFAEGQKTGKHYENTFFSTITEVGVPLALCFLLLPLKYINMYRKRNKYSLLYLGFILSCVFIGLVSPNLITNQSQMSIYIILGLLFWDSKLEDYNGKTTYWMA